LKNEQNFTELMIGTNFIDDIKHKLSLFFYKACGEVGDKEFVEYLFSEIKSHGQLFKSENSAMVKYANYGTPLMNGMKKI